MSEDVIVVVTEANPNLNVGVTENSVNIKLGDVLYERESHKKEQFEATQGQTDFLLSFEVKANSDIVFMNGVLQKSGVSYNIVVDTLIFASGLDEGDQVEINYVKK